MSHCIIFSYGNNFVTLTVHLICELPVYADLWSLGQDWFEHAVPRLVALTQDPLLLPEKLVTVTRAVYCCIFFALLICNKLFLSATKLHSPIIVFQLYILFIKRNCYIIVQ